jgi:hypothetical protein
MIAPAVVKEIRELLSEGVLSQRKIAVRMGVSRGTVNAIAWGKRPDRGLRARPRPDGFIVPSGPPKRCPGCGGMVKMPCLLCHVRALRARTRADRQSILPQSSGNGSRRRRLETRPTEASAESGP